MEHRPTERNAPTLAVLQASELNALEGGVSWRCQWESAEQDGEENPVSGAHRPRS